MTTKLEFEATITKAVPVIAKEAGYGYGDSGRGELQLTLSLKQPSKPREPYNSFGNRPRPEELKRKAKESDEEYEARAAERNRQIADWDSATAKYQDELAKYRLEQQTYQGRLMAYASLVGLAAVFGSKPMVVTLVPLEQGLLPDYGVSLLEAAAAPVDVTPSPPTSATSSPAPSMPSDTDECPGCGHQRSFHDDDFPQGCAEISDAGEGCPCENGTKGW